MSGSAAVAAVTSALRSLVAARVQADVAGSAVVARPPDRVLTAGAGNQVNLFLYHTSIDAAYRNVEAGGNVRRGEAAPSPLALVLHYLISAYGENDDETASDRLLGSAMLALHEHPVLDPATVAAALPGSGLENQLDRVRVTYEPLSIDELSRLWTTFQTQYRVSATYQACVVLIDSTQAARAPTPVLSRGVDDRGPVAQGDITLPFPRLDSVSFPAGRPDGSPGAELVLAGQRLAGTSTLRWTHLRTGATLDVPVAPGAADDSQIATQVPADPARISAGIYAVSALVPQPDGSELTTNAAPVTVVPAISSPLPLIVALSPAGQATIDVRCLPQVLPEQDVALVVGERPFAAAPRAARTDQLTFFVAGLPARQYLLRLRVDAVDSALIDYSGARPRFDPNQRVTLR